jgi:5'(3')-deoxyribonucleotidase
MRLGIDLDGVVANFNQGWVDLYNRQFGTHLTLEDSERWEAMIEEAHFEDMDQFWEWAADIAGHSLFWHLEPYPGAIEALRDLDAKGHQIVILTFKPEYAVEDTYEWIRRHGIPTNEVHILEEKWLVDCDVYLDDGPHVLPDLVANRPNDTVCRYVRPWNHPVPGAMDVRDFDEFREVVSRLAEAS